MTIKRLENFIAARQDEHDAMHDPCITLFMSEAKGIVAAFREAEGQRDDYARNLRLIMEEAIALHDNDGLKVGRICAILSDFTCPENIILEDAERRVQRQREQSAIEWARLLHANIASEDDDSDTYWGLVTDLGIALAALAEGTKEA